MDIIDNGVELDAEEVIQFFEDHHEADDFVYYIGDTVVGDITAITSDDRLVLDVDIPAATELYSPKYKVLAVTVDLDGNYIVKIVR